MACYRAGGCGPYEMYSCSECPASKPDYIKRGETDFLCPVCKFGDFGGFHGYKPNFCPNCGEPIYSNREEK